MTFYEPEYNRGERGNFNRVQFKIENRIESLGGFRKALEVDHILWQRGGFSRAAGSPYLRCDVIAFVLNTKQISPSQLESKVGMLPFCAFLVRENKEGSNPHLYVPLKDEVTERRQACGIEGHILSLLGLQKIGTGHGGLFGGFYSPYLAAESTSRVLLDSTRAAHQLHLQI